MPRIIPITIKGTPTPRTCIQRLIPSPSTSDEPIPKEYAKFFTEAEKKLYIIFVENEAVGIVAMSVASFDEDTEGFSYIDEIYVDKKYRGKGIAKDIVRRYLKHQENDCGFYILKENATSIAIWENFLKKENYMFEKIDAKEKLWFYRVKIGGKR